MQSVDDLRKQLVDLGLSEDEANEIKGKQNLIDKINALQEGDDIELETEDEITTVFSDENVSGERDVVIPQPEDPGWNEYVFTHFEDEEIFDGRPTVDGLRRVCRKLLGPILESVTTLKQTPSPQNEWSASVEHRLVVLIQNEETTYQKVISDVADGNKNNLDLMTVIHPSAAAGTRAEGRALRKMLGLRNIITAEEQAENTVADVIEETVNGVITHSQKVIIQTMSKNLGIDIAKMLAAGKTSYSSLDEMSFRHADDLITTMHNWKKDTTKIPQSIRKG